MIKFRKVESGFEVEFGVPVFLARLFGWRPSSRAALLGKESRTWRDRFGILTVTRTETLE